MEPTVSSKILLLNIQFFFFARTIRAAVCVLFFIFLFHHVHQTVLRPICPTIFSLFLVFCINNNDGH